MPEIANRVHPARGLALAALLTTTLTMLPACSCHSTGARGPCEPPTDEEFCARAHAECGALTGNDSCGTTRTVDCGACPDGIACGVPGGPNRCARCRAETDAAFCARNGFECGMAAGPDNCGSTRQVDCGACAGDLTCGGAGMSNRCGLACKPPSDAELCEAHGAVCGAARLQDRCGTARDVQCGACPSGLRCDEWNLCRPCTPESDAALCASLGKDCGTLVAADRCGNQRTLACGSCIGGLECGVVESNRCDYHWCDENGWCWVNPLPQGNTLWDVWASASNDAWAVGDVGTVIHWNGTVWERREPATRASLKAVWGFAANDVWAAGEQVILHWDGTRWSEVAAPIQLSWQKIWGASPRELWIIGEPSYGQFQALYWNGSSLMVATLPGEPVDIWGTGHDDVWLATAVDSTAQTNLFHFDGSAWTAATTPSGWEVISGWSSARRDVWVSLHTSSSNTSLSHWDGSAWSSPEGPACTSLWASDGEVFALYNLVSHWDGTQWTPQDGPPGLALQAVFGTAPTDVWAVGIDGELDHWNGQNWSSMTRRPLGRQVRSIWGPRDDDVWVAGRELRHWDGASWTEVPVASTPDEPIYPESVTGYGETQLWVFGATGELLRREGARWEIVLTRETRPLDLDSLGSAWDGGVWLIGATYVDLNPPGPGPFYRWNGSGFEVTGTPRGRARAMSSISADDTWAVGEHGSVEHWDGSSWSDHSLPDDIPVLGIVASEAGVWVGGAAPSTTRNLYSGVFYRWTGSQWARAPGEFPGVFAMSGDPDDFWAVGHGSVHFHRGSWTTYAAPRAPELGGVWKAPSGDVWAWTWHYGSVLRRSNQ